MLPGQMPLELGLSLGEAQVLDPDVVGQRRALGEEGVTHFAPVRLDLEVEDGDVVSEVAVVGEAPVTGGADVLLVHLMDGADVGVEPALGEEPLGRALRTLDVPLFAVDPPDVLPESGPGMVTIRF